LRKLGVIVNVSEIASVEVILKRTEPAASSVWIPSRFNSALCADISISFQSGEFLSDIWTALELKITDRRKKTMVARGFIHRWFWRDVVENSSRLTPAKYSRLKIDLPWDHK
jgi:hypothetical protein